MALNDIVYSTHAEQRAGPGWWMATMAGRATIIWS